jgi:OmpA-OmpF porin, OOP family
MDYLNASCSITRQALCILHIGDDPIYPKGIKSKVDNFQVIMDASSSMEERDGEYVKFDLAKSFAQRMNQTMPPLEVSGGLRTFGHDPAVARTFTALLYGMSAYQRADLAKALDSVSVPGGTSPMLEAINAASASLLSKIN